MTQIYHSDHSLQFPQCKRPQQGTMGWPYRPMTTALQHRCSQTYMLIQLYEHLLRIQAQLRLWRSHQISKPSTPMNAIALPCPQVSPPVTKEMEVNTGKNFWKKEWLIQHTCEAFGQVYLSWGRFQPPEELLVFEKKLDVFYTRSIKKIRVYPFFFQVFSSRLRRNWYRANEILPHF